MLKFLLCCALFAQPAIISTVERGALIVIEGVDRSGKSTQCMKLVESLKKQNVSAELMVFPDRTTPIGQVINDYLKNPESKLNDDRAIHLLFSANRWENADKMKMLIYHGVSLIVDRYSYSGMAFSAVKNGGQILRECAGVGVHEDVQMCKWRAVRRGLIEYSLATLPDLRLRKINVTIRNLQGAFHLYECTFKHLRRHLTRNSACALTLKICRPKQSFKPEFIIYSLCGMDLDWCKQSESGLPKPDLVFLFTLSNEVMKQRPGFGNERYETPYIQKRVSDMFCSFTDDYWKVIDADGSIDDVQQKLLIETIHKIEEVKMTPLQYLDFSDKNKENDANYIEHNRALYKAF